MPSGHIEVLRLPMQFFLIASKVMHSIQDINAINICLGQIRVEFSITIKS